MGLSLSNRLIFFMTKAFFSILGLILFAQSAFSFNLISSNNDLRFSHESYTSELNCPDTIDLGIQLPLAYCLPVLFEAQLTEIFSVSFFDLPENGEWYVPDGQPAEFPLDNGENIYSYLFLNDQGCLTSVSMRLLVISTPAFVESSKTISFCPSTEPFSPFDKIEETPQVSNGDWLLYDQDFQLLSVSSLIDASTYLFDPNDYDGEGTSLEEDAYLVYFTMGQVLDQIPLACGYGLDTLLLDYSGGEIDAGFISANQANPVCSDVGQVSFSVAGATGENLRWAVFNQGFQNLITTNSTGVFNIPTNAPSGVYKVVHVAYQDGVPLNEVSIDNFPDCFDASNALNLIITDCPQVSLSVSPNPTRGNTIIYVHSEEPTITTLSLFDSSGRLVRQVFTGIVEVESQFLLDMTDLPEGIYLIQLATDEERTTEKVVHFK